MNFFWECSLKRKNDLKSKKLGKAYFPRPIPDESWKVMALQIKRKKEDQDATMKNRREKVYRGGESVFVWPGHYLYAIAKDEELERKRIIMEEKNKKREAGEEVSDDSLSGKSLTSEKARLALELEHLTSSAYKFKCN